MTGRRRHRDRLHTLGRPRNSTLILIGLFVGVFALYILVRPVEAPAANVQQVTPTPTQTPYVQKTYSPSPTRTPTHSPSPTPHHTATRTPSQTPTPTVGGTSAPTSPLPSVSVPGGSPAA